MNSSQQNLKDNFSAFITDFVSKGYDFQMAITTSEAYRGALLSANCNFVDHDDEDGDSDTTDTISRDCRRFIGGIMDPTTPDLATYFTDRIVVGTSGSGDERVIQSSKDALEYLPNAGFLRADSHLAVILVSDEEDFSRVSGLGNDRYATHLHALTPESSVGGMNYTPIDGSTDSYETFFDTLTNTTSDFKNYSVSAIGIFDYDADKIDPDNASYDPTYNPDSDPSDYTVCQQEQKAIFNSTQQPSVRMAELADATNGVKASLCGNFAEGLIDIANNIIQLVTEYPLASEPIPESIVITIDEANVPEADLSDSDPQGWHYNTDKQSISFFGSHIPPQGSDISIVYTPTSI